VRSSTRSIIGAVALSLAVLPTAAWAGTSAHRTATTVPSQLPLGNSAKQGTLKVSPASGPPGTVVTLEPSVTCGKGSPVKAFLVDPTLDADPKTRDKSKVAEATTAAGEDGAWSVKLTVPKDAKVGTAYKVSAACYCPEFESRNPIVTYSSDSAFDVKGAETPKAPVAQPVTKSPTYTG
jgi:hypothetical protein